MSILFQYGDIYNFPQSAFNTVMEDEGASESEAETEKEKEGENGEKIKEEEYEEEEVSLMTLYSHNLRHRPI